MSILATRLSADGTLLAATSQFDEVTYTTNKVTSDSVYSNEFDEINLTSNVAMRQVQNKLLVKNRLDEFTYKNLNWSLVTSSATNSSSWDKVIFVNGYFYAFSPITDPTNIPVYSADGINWSPTTLPTGYNWSHIEYGNGIYVATDYSSDSVAYSTDNLNWSLATLPVGPTGGWYCVTWGNGIFVAISAVLSLRLPSNSTRFVYSYDGINWNAATDLRLVENFTKVVFNKISNIFLVGISGSYPARNSILKSNNGINWSVVTISDRMVLQDIIYFKNNYFISGSPIFIRGVVYPGGILKSQDGSNWVRLQNTNPSLSFQSMAQGKGLLLMLEYYTNYISVDGQNLTQTNYVPGWLVAYGNDKFISNSLSGAIGISNY
jgi:hypothetical protein